MYLNAIGESLKTFIDQCHQNSIGVINRWVPGHFLKMVWPAYFDGSRFTDTLTPQGQNTKESGGTFGGIQLQPPRESEISWFRRMLAV